jgi:hypothetical protein
VPQDFPPPPSHPLTFIRIRHGWSYQDLARVIAENARALGVPMAARREKIWRWEHWGVVPERDSQRALARALGVPRSELDRRPWPAWLPAHDGVPSGVPWNQEGALKAVDALLDDGGRDRRGYPLTSGAALREAAAEWTSALTAQPEPLTDQPQPLAAATQPPGPAGPPHGIPGDTVSEDTVAWLEAGVSGLRRLDDRLGGAAVRQRVGADLTIAVSLLRRGSCGPRLRARLFRVAADLAQLGGWAAADCGHHGAAQRYFLTGLRLAHCAADRPLAAGLWAGMSLEAVFADRCEDALAAAEASERAAAHHPGRLRAMLATRRARAHAGLGAETECRRALDEARSFLDTVQADDGGAGEAAEDGPSWLYWFDEAELVAQSGTALLRLGRAEEAAPLLERALAAQDPSYVRDRALYSARAACARMRAGDPGGASSFAERAAALGAQTCSPRPMAELARLMGDREPGR